VLNKILAFLLYLAFASPTKAWNDDATGFAIGGYDPVAYFTAGKAVPGNDKFQYTLNSSNWCFVNAGNKDAFVRSPRTYAPLFLGYDPYALARGTAVRGHPEIWSIYNGRLYLFQNPANKFMLLENPGKMLTIARGNWPALLRNIPLAPYTRR
jgi:YHS domain-containing protein